MVAESKLWALEPNQNTRAQILNPSLAMAKNPVQVKNSSTQTRCCAKSNFPPVKHRLSISQAINFGLNAMEHKNTKVLHLITVILPNLHHLKRASKCAYFTGSEGSTHCFIFMSSTLFHTRGSVNSEREWYEENEAPTSNQFPKSNINNSNHQLRVPENEKNRNRSRSENLPNSVFDENRYQILFLLCFDLPCFNQIFFSLCSSRCCLCGRVLLLLLWAFTVASVALLLCFCDAPLFFFVPLLSSSSSWVLIVCVFLS